MILLVLTRMQGLDHTASNIVAVMGHQILQDLKVQYQHEIS